jgi:hypothetical protein
VDADADLLHVVAALHTCGGLAHLLHRRQKQTNQDGDDGDDHQQLDQRESMATRTADMMAHDIPR